MADEKGTQLAVASSINTSMLIQLIDVTDPSMAVSGTDKTAVPSVFFNSSLDVLYGSAQGTVLYRDSSAWKALAPGTNGQVLTTAGASANPSWTTVGTGTGVTEVSKTTSFSATAGTFYVISGSSAVTATLPTAVGITGQVIRIRCASGYTGLLTIATTSAQTLGPGAATTQILYAGETALVQSDGANWVRAGGLLIPCFAKMTITAATTAISYNTETLVALNATAFDTTGQMANNGAGTITVFRTGQYRVYGATYWALAGANSYILYAIAYKNTSTAVTYHQGAIGINASNTTQTVEFGGSFLLTAGDVLILKVYQSNSVGSGSVNLLSGSSGAAVTFLEVQEVISW